MMHRTLARVAILMLLLSGSLLWPIDSQAGPPPPMVMTDYIAFPPFITSTTTPNILLIMDNSGSMELRACDANSCGILPDGTTSTDINFLATTLYTGYFDSLKCYSWDATDKRFGETTTTKPTLATACPATEWDGNFINWATFRRFDAVKKALHGGDCSGATAGSGANANWPGTRNADGTCAPIGSPSLITIKAIMKFVCTNCGHATAPVPRPAAAALGTPRTGAGGYVGRVPTSVTDVAPLNSPANLFFHMRGGDDGMQGSFCVDNDSDEPEADTNTCMENNTGSSDTTSVGPFPLRLVVPIEPRGVVQKVGLSARFGLQLFNTTDGGKLLTPVGGRQSINWDNDTTEPFNDNTSAMIDSLDEAYPKTWTPLGENLYQAATYVAQINSNFQSLPAFTNKYLYPLAFSPAAAYGTYGVGSIASGTTEIKGISGSETCPAGYLTNACGRDPYFFASNHTPAWASPSAVAQCCKTFVIIFTDGEPTQDQLVPDALKDYAHSLHGIHCTGSDPSSPTAPINSTCNTHPLTSASYLMGEHKTDYGSNGNHYLDDVAYWAHTTDLRQATIPVISLAGHDIPGFQNITLYTFFAFGNINGRGLLMQAAKVGGFEDSNGNNVPDNGLSGGSAAACSTTDLTQPCEWDSVNNVTGEAGRDGVPDTYYESSNVEDLQDRLLSTLQSILQQTASGTAASVLASSTTGEGTAYQAYFYPTAFGPSGQVKWSGYLHSLWVDAIGNLREDTVADGKLIYQNDKIIVTQYDSAAGEVLVDKYVDADGDGKADSTSCSPCDRPLNELVPIWEAGKQLALKDHATRKILTWVDTNNNGLVDATEQMAFSTANSTTLSGYVLAEGSGTSPFTANNMINFIRGEQITGLRNRHITVDGATKVWKLGDIVHSTPVIVGAPKERYDVIYGDSTYTAFFTQYKNRRQVAYVGANDGMLHAINGGFHHRGDDPSTGSATEHGWFTRTATDNSSGPQLGDELWGFIPYQLLPHLQWLTRGDYSHVYYVDLKPKVTDARIFAADATHPNGWGTILIGGFRLGGSAKDGTAGNAKEVKFKPTPPSGPQEIFYSAYFVLDITDPEADPKLLWSLTDEKMQLTTTYPAVLRVSTSTNKTDNTSAKWFAMFGSGPTRYDGASSQEGFVYIVDLKLGPGNSNSNVTRDASGYGKSIIGDMISLDANLDYRADVTYFGAAADTGQSPPNPKWEGKLFRLTTSDNGASPFGGSTNPNNWGEGNKPTGVLYDFSCSPSPGCSGPKNPGPMFAAPTVSMDDSLNVWVFIGTGRFWDSADKGNTEPQYFFGVKDKTINGGCTQNSDSDCIRKNLVNVSAAVVCSTCATGTNQVTDSNNTSVTTLMGTSATTSLQGLVASKEGWYTTLPTSGERALYSPTLLGGIVFFPTFVPATGGVCTGGIGSSSLYALFYQTGSAYKVSVVGTDTVGGNTNVKRSTALGSGVASQIGIHMGAQGTDSATGITSRSKACTQMSTGALACIQTQPALSAWSRYVSWINLRL